MSEKIEVGSIVEGKVLRVKPFGAIVSIGENTQGLVHISQIANSFVQDINDHVKVGDIVKVKVLSIEEESGKIALSIREALPKEPRMSRGEKSFRPRSERFTESREESRSSSSDFEEKMKEFMKQSNERQTSLNKRANKRSY